jgi:aryl-alcohol dehydrogenase-like predicted oxidoreductase
MRRGALLGAGAPLMTRADEAAAGPPTRPVPKSGERIPLVGLGTWRSFDVGPRDDERVNQLDVLRLLFEHGARVVDSSPMYGNSETVVGDLIQKLDARNRAFLATKVWTTGRADGIRQMETSMRRLHATQIDLMQVHNLTDWQTHLDTLRDWKEQRRVRFVGVTHYSASAYAEIARILETRDVDFVQFNYSIASREAERRLLPLAAERRVAVIINRPFEEGALFRAARGKDLPPWAADFDCTSWSQFFLKFILSQPAVTCAIPATANPAHLLDNLKAGSGRLPDANQRDRMAGYFAAG